MKLKVVITVFAALIIQLLNAQEEVATSRSNILGGSMSFSISNNSYPYNFTNLIHVNQGILLGANDDAKYRSFSFNPYYGKEISPSTTLGLRLSYSRLVIEDKVQNGWGGTAMKDRESTSNEIGFGIFSRHLINPASRLNFYLSPFLNYSHSKFKSEIEGFDPDETKTNVISLGVSAGLMYNFTEKWRAIVNLGNLSYVNGSSKREGSDESNDFSSFGLRASLNFITYGLEMRF